MEKTIADKLGNTVMIKENGEVSIRLYTSGTARAIGRIEQDIFRMKNKKKCKHLFRKNNSWGINYSLLNYLLEIGIEDICFLEKDNLLRYTVSAKDWLRHGTMLNFQGYELQVFLKDEFFNKE